MSKSRAECLRILGLPLTASEKEIKDAYRRKALELHPDKNPDDPESATERFQELQEAYNSLINSEEEDDEETIGIYEWLKMMIIMRERERRRRQFEQLFGFGGFFSPFVFHDDDDDDDDYYYHEPGRGFRRRQTFRPANQRHYHNRWESNNFENYSNNNSGQRPNRRDQYHGRAEQKNYSYAGYDENANSPSPSTDWIPEQPKQSSTRSAKQKKKKKSKKNKKKKEKERNINGGIQWDEESVASTIDSADISSEDDFESEEDAEKMENCKTEEVGANLKTEYIFPEKEKQEKLKDQYKNDEVNKDKRKDYATKNESSTAGIGRKSNSQAETAEEKAKVKVDNDEARQKKRNDSKNESSYFCASRPDEEIRVETSNTSKPSAKRFENKEKKNTTSKNQNAQSKNSSFDGEYLGRNKIIDESLFKETTNSFYHEENTSAEELEDWSNFTFPAKQEVNSTIKSGKATKSTDGGKGEKVPKFPNRGTGGEEVLTSNNKGKGEKVPKTTNRGKGSEEVSEPTAPGENRKNLPKGVHSYQNGKTRFSYKDLGYDGIKKRYGWYIDKHVDPTLTERYKKLIETAS